MGLYVPLLEFNQNAAKVLANPYMVPPTGFDHRQDGFETARAGFTIGVLIARRQREIGAFLSRTHRNLW